MRGASLELATVREWPGVVLRRDPLVVTFPGTSTLDLSSPVHLTFRVTGVDGPAEGGLLVCLGSTPGDVGPDGFVGAVAFFAHAGHAQAPCRLPLTAALDRLGRTAAALTVTLVPTRSHPLDVAATVALVRSTVSR